MPAKKPNKRQTEHSWHSAPYAAGIAQLTGPCVPCSTHHRPFPVPAAEPGRSMRSCCWLPLLPIACPLQVHLQGAQTAAALGAAPVQQPALSHGYGAGPPCPRCTQMWRRAFRVRNGTVLCSSHTFAQISRMCVKAIYMLTRTCLYRLININVLQPAGYSQ
eukprot:1157538-Pelagomonas_calceolata.AAC.1